MSDNRPKRIGRLEDIADPGSREFSLLIDGSETECFLVRTGTVVHAYINRCPHTARFLNWKPDTFLTGAGDLIMCSVHGAVFEIESGLCVGGPCPGRYLDSLVVEVRDGVIFVEAPSG